jgi:hypothetical protein
VVFVPLRQIDIFAQCGEGRFLSVSLKSNNTNSSIGSFQISGLTTLTGIGRISVWK